MMQILRWAGAALLPLCGWLTGTMFQARARQHIAQLQHTVELLQRIRQEIAYRRPGLEQLQHCLLQEGMLADLERADTLQQLAPPELFTPEEQLCFTQCFSGLGRSAAVQECERLDYYDARFTEFLHRAQQQADAKAGLPGRLGLAAGAVLALLVL